jgi:phosphoribosyl 1,2-cyclic phosphodiesterase
VVEENGDFLLVDVGGSCRATMSALESVGLALGNLQGILITHEHVDHIKGLAVLLKKVKVPVFATAATLEALREGAHVPLDAELVPCDSAARQRGAFCFEAFPTSHDAAGCCGWRIIVSGAAMTLATDLGEMTPEVYGYFEDAELVALEANYDPVLLRTGAYPGYLKKRIASPVGHLSNQMSAQTVARLMACGCRRVALCHLSAENNTRRHVMRAVEAALIEHGVNMSADCVVQVAKRHEVSDWMLF